jgi:hypothetical protein
MRRGPQPIELLFRDMWCFNLREKKIILLSTFRKMQWMFLLASNPTIKWACTVSNPTMMFLHYINKHFNFFP